MKRRTLLASSAMALGLAVSPALADDPLKVGFVYVGPVGDYGWTATHDAARQMVEEHFGDGVETSYVESVPEGADAERVMTQMALSGHELIFATSFGFGPDANNVAARFPDVKFEHATGYTQDHDNVSLYNARFYEGRAVIGHIAGKMTETNTIGYIASYPIPEVIMGINSAYLHAKAANPDVQFRIIWVYSWFDPAQEADAATALIEQGADVLMQHTDSSAPIAIAQENGVMAFGQASDMVAFGPDAHLTAILDEWGPYYIERIQAVMDSTWQAGDVWHGFAEGMVALAPLNERIPEDVRAEAEFMIEAIAAGEYHPFTGPINRQDGSPWLAEGETAPDGDLLGMNFYVEGITAEIPN
ncbi:BMP family ABC transporter substrate-binding protein [Alkalilacustris brevis]|uniref:BMP family ABC transporter substrate-binding protein n=1 Tax=Alkalilacustris brevis TaxID=2026338 RepID=UPI000E0D354B|nr:BMP family ABC transporter substrate-binding protein [Alkalilacustris brevis]